MHDAKCTNEGCPNARAHDPECEGVKVASGMSLTSRLAGQAGLAAVLVQFLFGAADGAPLLAIGVGQAPTGQAPEAIQRSSREGIQRLSEETQHQAIDCGKIGAECAVTPYLLCPSEDQPFSARIATPYSRVADSVYEAKARHRRPEPPTPGAVNVWGVGVFVSPAADSRKADSIVSVHIRRGTETIDPSTTTLAPVVLQNGPGRNTTLSKGFFAFPMDTFRPTSDLTIVFTGSNSEMRCTLDRSRLAALR